MSRTAFFALLLGMCSAVLPGMTEEIRTQSIQGEERASHLKHVSHFYNLYYREPPYFYDSSEASWDRYIRSYVDEPESVLCFAIQDEIIIGIAIGTPLAKTTQKYKAAFADRMADLQSLFFLGELAVKPEYASVEVIRRLYEEFERQVAEKNQFSGICIWQLQSEENKASGLFLAEAGFTLTDIRFEELWKDTFGAEKVPHSMVCWKKQL